MKLQNNGKTKLVACNESVIIIVEYFCIQVQSFNYRYDKKTKCLNPPRTARRVENHIKGCQEERLLKY
uniref:Uncharacterized protein n=1 Tax=Glossina palpalis gambiensis TaxID=67801 RepID=A0A1B0B987_9MUSC